ARGGKSYALNSGVREARGDILAFTDDDVAVQSTWLRNLTAPFEDTECAGTGGRILPAESFSPPAWMPPSDILDLKGILFGSFDRGEQPGPLSIAPYGANMAFRKRMFEKYGGFRTDLGPSPDPRIPRPNEDTE